MFLPHFDVFCDLLLNRRTATWNLFVLYNNETNYHRKLFFFSKSFNITRKLVSAHFGEHEKKPFDEAISVIGPGKSRHCQTGLERHFSWNENLQRKQNRTAKSTNLKENIGLVKSLFVIRAAL